MEGGFTRKKPSVGGVWLFLLEHKIDLQLVMWQVLPCSRVFYKLSQNVEENKQWGAK